MKTFDCIVIGAGSGGLNMAGFLNTVGLKVLLVDKSDRSIGGDCLNYGCVPSKALVHVARLMHDGKEAEAFGMSQKGVVDIRAVMDYVRTRQDIIRAHENAEYFRDKGMTVALGEARFVRDDEIEVDGVRYRGKKIVLATGGRPRMLDIPGSEHVHVYTNETIFDMTEFPQHLVVLGGGPIGFEMGQAFCRLGSEVAIVNIADSWLPKEHRDVVQPLVETMKKEGVSFISNATVKKLTKEKKAVVEKDDGSQIEVPCDALFVGVGRIPNTDGLALSEAGVKTDERGRLVLDTYLRTTNKRIFAVGDVVGAHQFTHATEVHASAVLSNMFKPRPFWKKLNTDAMAWVTYTDPEIATFGLSENELHARGEKFEVIKQSFSDNDRSITDNRTEGFMRLVVSKRGSLLGGTLVGDAAGELVGELILAQSEGLGMTELFSRVSPYPTRGRVLKLAAGKYMTRRLSKAIKSLLRLLY
jgi:pyruvate/2-oxoglutarate dehydrogenase complex dihydrolipoamide dehydrogenase (E3) component